jgi:hypothetical protein
VTAEAGARVPGDPAGAPARSGPLVVARVLHALLALAAAGGVALEVSRALTEGPGDAGTTTERLIRLFSYFTIQSNLLVLVASALLAARPARTGRVLAVLHLDALLCIAVTGVVYHTVLADAGVNLTPSGDLANFLLHTVTPIGTWVVWLLVGPRPRFAGATVAWSVVYPLAWIAYTFARGAATGWYPYPFLDAGALGLATAARNTAVVAVGFLVLAVLVRLLERVLPAAPRTPRAP